MWPTCRYTYIKCSIHDSMADLYIHVEADFITKCSYASMHTEMSPLLNVHYFQHPLLMHSSNAYYFNTPFNVHFRSLFEFAMLDLWKLLENIIWNLIFNLCQSCSIALCS